MTIKKYKNLLCSFAALSFCYLFSVISLSGVEQFQIMGMEPEQCEIKELFGKDNIISQAFYLKTEEDDKWFGINESIKSKHWKKSNSNR